MASEFHLYRAKFIRPQQADMFRANETPQSLLLQSLSERPYSNFRLGYTWHIGNLTKFNETSGFFAIGRNSTTSIPKLDPRTGDFGDTEDSTSPYTFVVYDSSIGLFAIQRQRDLASSTEEIASKIRKLLAQTAPVMQNEVEVKVDLIPDPEDFISKIEDAHAIKRFTATFTGPNPVDADKLFQKPLSVYLSEAKGTSGKTTIQGSHLSSEVVAAVARSTAATANTASARIQEKPGKRAVTVQFSGNPVQLSYDGDPDLKTVLKDSQNAYRKVRSEAN